MNENDFEAGRRAEKTKAVEKLQEAQNKRLDLHDTRLTALEKVHYGFIGIMLIITFKQEFVGFFGG
jgi:hypothetical protein